MGVITTKNQTTWLNHLVVKPQSNLNFEFLTIVLNRLVHFKPNFLWALMTSLWVFSTSIKSNKGGGDVVPNPSNKHMTVLLLEYPEFLFGFKLIQWALKMPQKKVKPSFEYDLTYKFWLFSVPIQECSSMPIFLELISQTKVNEIRWHLTGRFPKFYTCHLGYWKILNCTYLIF